jgi:hypothetical protein
MSAKSPKVHQQQIFLAHVPAVSGIGHYEKFYMILHVSKMTLQRQKQKRKVAAMMHFG